MRSSLKYLCALGADTGTVNQVYSYDEWRHLDHGQWSTCHFFLKFYNIPLYSTHSLEHIIWKGRHWKAGRYLPISFYCNCNATLYKMYKRGFTFIEKVSLLFPSFLSLFSACPSEKILHTWKTCDMIVKYYCRRFAHVFHCSSKNLPFHSSSNKNHPSYSKH